MVTLTGDLGRHLVRSLRMRAGESVRLVDGDTLLITRVEEITADTLTACIIDEARLPADPARITLVVGMPKGRKLEEIVRHTVEAGVHRIVPVYTARSVPRPRGGKEGRHARLAAIALEAAQQSGRRRVPDVAEPVDFSAYIMQVSETESERSGNGADSNEPAVRVTLWEGERHAALADLLRPPVADVTLFVGPEGGLSEEEVGALGTHGFQCAGIGPHILRTETACIAAVAMAAGLLWTPG